MPPSPEIPQTPHEKLLVDAVEALPVNLRTDSALQLQDEAAENPITSIFSPVDSKRAEILLGWAVARAKLAELSRNRAIAGSLNLTEEQIRAAIVEGSASLTQGNRVYQLHHFEPDGTSISNRRHRDILLVRQHELLNPQVRKEWGQWMRRELRRLGPDQIREYQSRIEDYGLVGLMPSPDVLWMGVRLEAAKNDLAGLVGNGGAAAPSLRETMVFADQLLSGGAIDPAQAFQRMTQGTAMGRTMLAEYQNAFNRWREAYLSFPPDVQESILASWLIGGQIMGGQAAIMPNFYSSAFKQIGRESSFHSSFFDALAFARKQEGIEGYIPMDSLYQAIGSTKPEVIGFIDHANSVHDLWVDPEDLPERLRNDPEYINNPDKSLHFKLSTREMLGVYGTIDMLARMGTNTAQDIVDGVRTKEGFWSTRNNTLGRYVFHKMGYSEGEIDDMFRRQHFPRLRRSSDLSKVTGNEITNFWDWIGEVSLDKMLVALSWIQWSRIDVETVPLDLKRRNILSFRGVFLAAYRLGYALGLPPEQFRNMIALFGSACSIDREAMLEPTQRNLRSSSGFIDVVTLDLFGRNAQVLPQQVSAAEMVSRRYDEFTREILGGNPLPKDTKRLIDEAQQNYRRLYELRMQGGNLTPDQQRRLTLYERIRSDAETRRAIIDQTSSIKRPIISASRALSRLVTGQGEFATADPEEFRRCARDFLNKLPSMGTDALRPPELWKHRWFKNADSDDVNSWEFIPGTVTVNGRLTQLTEAVARSTFEGVDFSQTLLECGLREDEVAELQCVGYEGWRNSLKYVNIGNLHWAEMGYTTGDKNPRYLPKVDKAGDVTINFMEVSSPMMPEPFKMFNPNVVNGGLRQDLLGRRAEVVHPQPKYTTTNDPKTDALAAYSATNLLRDGISKALTPFTEALAFIPNHMQARFIEANLDIFMDGHFAHGLDSLVEKLDLEKLEGGDNFSVSTVYAGDNDIPEWRMKILKSEGFYTVEDPNKPGKEQIISPLVAPIPRLVTARQLLEDTKAFATQKIQEGTDVSRYQYLEMVCKFMSKKGAFCWDTLVSRRTDISPAMLKNAIEDLKEEGPASGATIQTILTNLLDFVGKDHPGSQARGLFRNARLGGNSGVDEKTFLVPLLLR